MSPASTLAKPTTLRLLVDPIATLVPGRRAEQAALVYREQAGE